MQYCFTWFEHLYKSYSIYIKIRTEKKQSNAEIKITLLLNEIKSLNRFPALSFAIAGLSVCIRIVKTVIKNPNIIPEKSTVLSNTIWDAANS